MHAKQVHWREANLADSELQASGLSREAKAGTCPRCHRAVLRGLDADRCAMTVEVDCYAISVTAEAVALLRGAETFDKVLIGGRFELNYRYGRHLRQARKYDVHVSHDCSFFFGPADQPVLQESPVALLSDVPPF